MGQGLTCLVSVVLFVVLLVAVFTLTGRGEAKARARLDALGPEAWREGLQALLAAAPAPPAALLYVPEPTGPGPAPARLGGVPVLGAGTDWPRDAHGHATTPLLQVVLAAPPLPAAWHGHRLTVFLEAAGEVPHARVEAPPLRDAVAAPPPPGARVLREVPLWPLGVEDPGHEAPGAAADAPPPFLHALQRALFVWAERHGVPAEGAVARLVAPVTDSPVDLGDPYELVRVGGTPFWVQDWTPGPCAACGGPRVLLLQVGDVFAPEPCLGDEGSVFVLGCAERPEHPVEALLQRA